MDLISRHNTQIHPSFEFKEIGRFWDRKGEVEIDFVGKGIEKGQVCFGEIKLNSQRINKDLIKKFKQKASLPLFDNLKEKKLFVFTLDRPSSNKLKFLTEERILHFSLEEFYSQLQS